MGITKRSRRQQAVPEVTPKTPAPPSGPPPAPTPQRRAQRRTSLSALGPVLLVRAAHPRQALLTALGVTVAAALTGRSSRELGLILATVLVGQTILGWHNDLVDRRRDLAHDRRGKPVAHDLLDPSTVWFTLLCAVLLVVPLSMSNGITAGSIYLMALGIGLLGNVFLRRGLLSWLPWAASYALYPAFLSYGGWGGDALGDAPEPLVCALAALLGIGVHVLVALPGLVPDHEDGLRHLPLRLALRLGAPRLLLLASIYAGLVVAALLAAGNAVGLAR